MTEDKKKKGRKRGKTQKTEMIIDEKKKKEVSWLKSKQEELLGLTMGGVGHFGPHYGRARTFMEIKIATAKTCQPEKDIWSY
ncbi:uncharacterized [Tachysurus ichikawai]